MDKGLAKVKTLSDALLHAVTEVENVRDELNATKAALDSTGTMFAEMFPEAFVTEPDGASSDIDAVPLITKKLPSGFDGSEENDGDNLPQSFS